MHKMGTLPNLTLEEKQVRRIRCARTFWAAWVMQTMESGFISTAAILWKENIRRFCRSERTPNVVQKFGSFWFFLRNASLESGLFQLQSEHPQILSTQISNQLEKLDSHWDFRLQTCWTSFQNCDCSYTTQTNRSQRKKTDWHQDFLRLPIFLQLVRSH